MLCTSRSQAIDPATSSEKTSSTRAVRTTASRRFTYEVTAARFSRMMRNHETPREPVACRRVLCAVRRRGSPGRPVRSCGGRLRIPVSSESGVASTVATHPNYLVDPASSHMLVSKTKPCTSKNNREYTRESADGSLDQLWFIGEQSVAMDNCGNSRANTCD